MQFLSGLKLKNLPLFPFNLPTCNKKEKASALSGQQENTDLRAVKLVTQAEQDSKALCFIYRRLGSLSRLY